MFRRVLLALAGSLITTIAACSLVAQPTTTTTTTTAPTTTTLPPTTTTTLPPFAVDGAPPELVATIEGFYDYAAARASEPPPMAEGLKAGITPAPRETPLHGVASVAAFHGQNVATAEVQGDTLLAVAEGGVWRIVGGNWPSLGIPAYWGGSPRLIAVIGSDARPGEDVLSKMADSIHIVGLDGAGGGGVVGIPRDSYVPVSGVGRRKITAALALSGPDVLLQTLRDLTGLPIEGYVLTGFVGFQEMLGNVLGGINLEVPFAINDRAAGASFEPGLQYLNGPDALAFARARKTLPSGDFTRSLHQGMILIGAAQTVQTRGYGSIPTLMEASQGWMFTNLTPEQLLTFSALAIGSDLANMPNLVAPGTTGRAGSASVVFLADSVSQIWTDLGDGRYDG